MAEGEIVGGEYSLVPDGVYDVVLVDYLTKYIFRSPKLILNLRIVEQGEHYGKTLSRYYNVKKLKSKAGKNGDFQVSRGSDFVYDFHACFGIQKRLDRMPMTRFKNVIIRVKTKTVKKNYRQREIPECLKYSVIGELLGVKEI